MEKVYLILRNNVQEGPFTSAELLQQGLKPKDLVWVEGKSIAWVYVKDLKEINQISGSSIQTEAKLTHSSVTSFQKEKRSVEKKRTDLIFSDDLEQRAELIRQRAEAFAKEHPERTYTPPFRNEQKTPELYEVERAIDLVIHKRSHVTISAGQLLMVAIATTVLTAAWNGKVSLIPQKTNSSYTSIASAPSIFTIQPKKAEVLPVPVSELAETISNTSESSHAAMISVNQKIRKQAVQLPVPEKTIAFQETSTSSTAATAFAANTSTPLNKDESPVKDQPEAIKNSEVKENNVIDELTSSETHEKKKTLGEAIKGIFKKKKKDKEEPSDTQD
jgi:hypothetical protein